LEGYIMAHTTSKVTSITKSVKAKPAISAPATPAKDNKGNEFVLKADIQAATKYTMAYLLADSAVENAEREFCKAFAHNHEGHLKAAIKAGFAAIKAAGAFDGLSKQSIDNLSSAAQWIALQPYNTQDDLFEAVAFRKAYQAARWPVSVAPSVTVEPVEPAPSKESHAAPLIVPHKKAATSNFNEACNDIAVELNTVIEHIAEVIRAYPEHQGNASLGALALDIGRAIEKAAHARLQAMQNDTVAPRQAVAA
jgi:hypothetical protein